MILVYPFAPRHMTLDLRRPIYQQVAAYGHFGRPELDLPWEKVDRVQELLAKA